ncbi:hypothetical protein [Rhizobium sp. LEGMi198b]
MRQTQIIAPLVSGPGTQASASDPQPIGGSGALTPRGKALVGAQKTKVSLGDSVRAPLSNGTVFCVRKNETSKKNTHVTFASGTSTYGLSA